MYKPWLKSSKIGRDFFLYGIKMDVDTVLDHRLINMQYRKEKKYPDAIYYTEIKACDEILRFLNDSTAEGN